MLRSGESLMWSGSPDGKRLFLVLLPGLAFGVFWTSRALASLDRLTGWEVPGLEDPSIFPVVIEALFLAAGVLMLFGSFWLYNRTRRIFYALTDKRFIVLDGEEVHNFNAGQLSGMSADGERKGRIEFRSLGDAGLSGDLTRKPRVTTMTLVALLLGFFTLPDFRRVVGMLKDLKRKEPDDRVSKEG